MPTHTYYTNTYISLGGPGGGGGPPLPLVWGAGVEAGSTEREAARQRRIGGGVDTTALVPDTSVSQNRPGRFCKYAHIINSITAKLRVGSGKYRFIFKYQCGSTSASAKQKISVLNINCLHRCSDKLLLRTGNIGRKMNSILLTHYSNK